MSPVINETDYKAWKNRYGFKLLEDEVIRAAYQDALNQGFDQAILEPAALQRKIEEALEEVLKELEAPTHQPLMSEEDIRAHQPHPGPVGGIGSPPKEAAE